MRITIVALVVFMVCSICPADVNDVNSMTIAQCRARILELERIVKSQRNQIEKLIAELTEKPSETQVANKGTNSAGEFRYSDGMVYRGKRQTSQFFNYWYDEFKDRVICYNGQYLKASAQKYDCTVLKVINDNEAIVLMSGYNVIECSKDNGQLKEHVTNFENTRCYIKGYNRTFADEEFTFNGCLIENGSYQYTTLSGTKATIPSYILVECKTLNKEQFADAINSGFELTK